MITIHEERIATDCPQVLNQNMVVVPAGEFVMGTSNDPEAIAHKVGVDGFIIDTNLVSNGMFALFVHETLHVTVAGNGECWERHAALGRINEAVACVSWYDAMAFCEWRSRRTGALVTLPTEAQWEKAISLALLTPSGMRELCRDWYGSSYYRLSPYQNPTGPETGLQKCCRYGQRPKSRGAVYPNWCGSPDLGFRCAIES